MDLRVEYIFQEEMKGDTSFQKEEGFLSSLFSPRITNSDLRDAWEKGIKHGIEIGLRKASLEGQQIEINQNSTSDVERMFLQEFHDLCSKYKCAIQYHPEKGMVVINRDFS